MDSVINFPNGTAPDIHAEGTSYWNVKQSPSYGNTYLGLSVREDESWESVSQQLSEILEAEKCYTFTIDLCKSPSFLSGVKDKTKENLSFGNAVALSIWNGNGYCNELELLYESPPVDNEDWQSYEVNIRPIFDVKYITLQAYYIDNGESYNGNILLDNISPIVMISCNK